MATEAESVALAAATALVRVESRLMDIWPSYWGGAYAFAVYPVRGATFVVTPSDSELDPSIGLPYPGDELPHELRGRAYLVDALPTPPFDLDFQVGDDVIGAVSVIPPLSEHRTNTSDAPWLADPVATQVMFIAHEGFHTYQAVAFEPLPGSAGGSAANLTPIRPFQHLLDEPSIALALRAERHALRTALLTSSENEARSSVLRYLELKDDRLQGMPTEFRAFEYAHERFEGTANWVGYHIVREVLGLHTGDTRRHIVSDLGGFVPDSVATGWAGYWQMHLYAAGAAKAELLEWLGPEDWKVRLERGSTLDELLGAGS